MAHDYAAGFVSLLRGMHGGIEPDILAQDQYAKGLNVSSRRGLISTRPMFKEFAASGSLPVGLFQGAAVYRLNAADRIIFAVAGGIYGINTDTNALTTYAVAGSMSATAERFYFAQADKYMIVQDGVNRPYVIGYADDPDAATQASGVEVPTGTIMAYGHGRLYVVVTEIGGVDAGQRFFAAGDIMLPNNPITVLSFTETDYLAGGGALSLPNELGFITGMAFLRNARTGSGDGALIVMAQHGCSSFSVNAPRGQWQDITISQILFTDAGTRSPFGLISVNSDLMFRGMDGLRTIGFSVASIQNNQTLLANEPISREVDDILALDGKDDLGYVFGAFVDSRAFYTAIGATDDSGQHYFKSLVVLDGSSVSSFGKPYTPAYDGIWTGFSFLSLHKAFKDEGETLYSFVKDDDGFLYLVYLSKSEDDHVDCAASRTLCRLYTRVFDFGKQIEPKRVKAMELWLSDIHGELDVTAYWRPAGYPLWNAFSEMETIAGSGSLGHMMRRLRFTISADACDPVMKKKLDLGEEFQFCVQWTGQCRIRKAVFFAEKNTEQHVNACEVSVDGVVLAAGEAGIEIDDLTYEVEL